MQFNPVPFAVEMPSFPNGSYFMPNRFNSSEWKIVREVPVSGNPLHFPLQTLPIRPNSTEIFGVGTFLFKRHSRELWIE